MSGDPAFTEKKRWQKAIQLLFAKTSGLRNALLSINEWERRAAKAGLEASRRRVIGSRGCATR
jgi:hypothetical protein